jgi:sugar phosphate isomerase/epimerase
MMQNTLPVDYTMPVRPQAVAPTFALSTGSLYTYGLARTFELAAEAGFDAMEILVDQRWDSRQPDYLRRLSADSGLPIAAVHNPFKPFVPGWPHDVLGRLRQSAAVARAVGAGVVVAHLPLRIGGAEVQFFGLARGKTLLPLPIGAEKKYRDFLLNGLAAFEAEAGVTIAVENMPARRVLGRPLDIHWLNSAGALAGMPHLTLDTTHIGTWGLDLLATYEQVKWHLAHVHLSDFDGREHRLPGTGHLPLAGLLGRLARDGYRGAVTVELGPEVLEAEDEGRVRAHLRQIVAFCRQHAGQPVDRVSGH